MQQNQDRMQKQLIDQQKLVTQLEQHIVDLQLQRFNERQYFEQTLQLATFNQALGAQV